MQVHRIFPDGLAAQEGTIERGSEVLSINGKSLKGATHQDALAVLRQARGPPQAVVVTRKLEHQPPTVPTQPEEPGKPPTFRPWGPPVVALPLI